MITEKEIEGALTSIYSRLKDHLANNKNSANIGQFFEEHSHTGIYGISSGLRILGIQNNSEDRIVISELVEKLNAENWNEITLLKATETLYSLSLISFHIDSKENVKNELINHIQTKKKDHGKWGFENSDVDLILTASAVLALRSWNIECDNAIKYCIQEVESNLDSPNLNLNDYAITIFTIYVLDQVAKVLNNNTLSKDKFKVWVKKAVKTRNFLFDYDFEQNIEYLENSKTKYTRIPWQFYLIILTHRYQIWYFSKAIIQNRLKEIIRKVNSSEGFKFPSSGSKISTRTNSILYESLFNLKDLDRNHIWIFVINLIDQVRLFFASKIAKESIKYMMGFLMIFICWQWYNSSDKSLKDLAPEIIGPFLFWIYSLGQSQTKN